MFLIKRAILLLVLLVGWTGVATAQNLLLDGDFQLQTDGNPIGGVWTPTGITNAVDLGGGNLYAVLFRPSSVTQVSAVTTVGTIYALRGVVPTVGVSDIFRITIGGVGGSITDFTSLNMSAGGTFDINLIGDGAAHQVSFAVVGASGGIWGFDNVTLQNSVPEIDASTATVPIAMVLWTLLLMNERRRRTKPFGVS